MKIKFLDGTEREFESLVDADLRGANLSGANLYGADLHSANLRGANLYGAFFSPTRILSASWGDVSDSLCADLMELDASAHPDRTKFDEWAKGGICPYAGVSISRIVNFRQKHELWGTGKIITIWEAMTRLFAEKNIKF